MRKSKKDKKRKKNRNRAKKQGGSLLDMENEPEEGKDFYKPHFMEDFGWSEERFERKWLTMQEDNESLAHVFMRDGMSEERATSLLLTPKSIAKELYEEQISTPWEETFGTRSRDSQVLRDLGDLHQRLEKFPEKERSQIKKRPRYAPEEDPISEAFLGVPPERREGKQEGSLMVPPEMEKDMPTEEDLPVEEDLVATDIPVDTYPNATPEEIEEAQEPDEEMEDGYMEFILNEALVPEEQEYLMNSLEVDPQLSIIFDKVVETASEFSGAGEVQGPGDGLSDSIPARLSDGEFVITKKATDQIGADNLQTIMDEAEQAYDGGLMRQQRYLGGELKDDEDQLIQRDRSTDDDIRKLMSIKANKSPSLR